MTTVFVLYLIGIYVLNKPTKLIKQNLLKDLVKIIKKVVQGYHNIYTSQP